MIRFVQIACIAVTALVLFAFRESFLSLRVWFGPDFPIGFLCGAFFMMVVYLLIIWVDPSSRPRGSASKQD